MKINAKRLAALMLALCMLPGLCACAAKPESAPAPAPEARELSAQPAEPTEPPLSGETAFVSEYTTVYERGKDHLNPRVYTDEGFYSLTFDKVGDNTPEGVTPLYENEYAVYESRLSFVGFDGSVRPLTAYASSPAPENLSGAADFSSSADLGGFAIAPDGSLCVLETLSASWYDGPQWLDSQYPEYWDYRQSSREYVLRRLDGSTGAELSRCTLQVPEEDSVYTHTLAFDAKGNIILIDDDGLRLFTPEGKPYGQIVSPNFPDTLLSYGDGRIALSYWSNVGMDLAPVDTDAMSIGEGIPLPANAYSLTPGVGDYEVFYIEGSSFYGFDAETGEEEKLFSWINCGVEQSSISAVKALADGSFVTVSNEYVGAGEEDFAYDVNIIRIREVPVEHIPQKKLLTFATVYLDTELSSFIVDFNRRSDEYKIEVTDYFEYNSDYDSSLAVKLLSADLLSGKSFDIIDLSGLQYKYLAAHGAFADLYPFLDSDTALSRESIMPNVLSALEVNGGLYSTASGFSVNSLCGYEALLGVRSDWSYDELDRVLAAMPMECDLLNLTTSGRDVLERWLPFELDRCVNWQTGECNFNNESFIALLNFASRFPREFDWDNYQWTEADSVENRITQGRQLLMENSLHSFDDVHFNTATFGADVSYVGYPGTEPGLRSRISLSHRLAMGANSSDKEGAWQFLRAIFTEELQQRKVWNFPSNAALFEKRLAEAMEIEYKTDAQGQFVLDDSGEKIPVPKGSMGSAYGTVVSYYAISEHQAAKLRELLSSATALDCYEFTNAVGDIVFTEADRFFAGAFSAEAAAENINLRVEEYLKSLG